MNTSRQVGTVFSEQRQTSPVVDAHHHLWRLSDGDYAWLRSMPELVRDFTVEDFLPLLEHAGIDSTIIVQAIETEAETAGMLELAHNHDWIAGVIGWVDLAVPDAKSRVEWLASNPRAVGMRNWAMTRADSDWLSEPGLDAGFAALASTRLTYDALVNPANLPALRSRLRRSPGLRVCIDHLAYPNPNWLPDGDEEKEWVNNLSALAEAGCVIKLSGFGHKLDGLWQPDRFQRHTEMALEIFGSSGVIWASNWPTVLTECGLQDWYDACIKWTGALSPAEKAAVFGGNARRFYSLASAAR